MTFLNPLVKLVTWGSASVFGEDAIIVEKIEI
jgi:hypothetical protein